jgi:hypothetical protein
MDATDWLLATVVLSAVVLSLILLVHFGTVQHDRQWDELAAHGDVVELNDRLTRFTDRATGATCYVYHGKAISCVTGATP